MAGGDAHAAPMMNHLGPPRLDRVLSDELFKPLYSWGDGQVPTFHLFVGGAWRPGTQLGPVDSPIDGNLIARVPEATPSEVEAAVTAAAHARRAIRDMPGHRRIEVFEEAARLLSDHREALEEMLLLEAGKPAHDRQGEVKASGERLRATHQEAARIYGDYIPGDWASDTVGKMALVIREPLGVVACVCPFNYPLFIPTAKIVPALLAGNTVVAKGSHQTPLSLLLLARVLETAGLPPGTLNVITGSGASAGEALVTDARIRMVSFTGSTEVGRRIYSIGGIKKFHLELGGKGHAIVFDDADVKLAAERCVEGALKNAGQRCDAVSAVVVQEAVADEFAKEARRAIETWKAGDPREVDTRVGPLINDQAADRVTSYVEEAERDGARKLAGGGRVGRLVQPTLVDEVKPQTRLASRETFGPVLPIIRAASEEDALDLATRTPYGLDSCVFTRSFERMWRASKRLECGEVTLNDLPRHGVGHFPFGGQRESGIGREGIGYSIEEMTELKTIVFTLGRRTAR